jgi:hypothetical protein
LEKHCSDAFLSKLGHCVLLVTDLLSVFHN